MSLSVLFQFLPFSAFFKPRQIHIKYVAAASETKSADINHKNMTFMFVVIRISERMVFIATAIETSDNKTKKTLKNFDFICRFT